MRYKIGAYVFLRFTPDRLTNILVFKICLLFLIDTSFPRFISVSRNIEQIFRHFGQTEPRTFRITRHGNKKVLRRYSFFIQKSFLLFAGVFDSSRTSRLLRSLGRHSRLQQPRSVASLSLSLSHSLALIFCLSRVCRATLQQLSLA